VEPLPLESMDDENIIKKMLQDQQASISFLRPTTKILKESEREVDSIFTYIARYKDLSKTYFVDAIKTIDKL
jgi:hypothetical protein